MLINWSQIWPQTLEKAVARDEPDAIRLISPLLKDCTGKLVFEMAAMHWYAEGVS